MITAQFLGGPRDGDRIALPDHRPLRIPVLHAPGFGEYSPNPAPDIHVIEIQPVLTNRGWILPWHEP